MQRYVEQLIDDLRKARTKVKPPSSTWDYADIEDEGEIEDMAYVEKYIYGEQKPMHEITGIATHLLPPAEKLNNEQTKKLVKELEALMEHFHFVADFPERLPLEDRYPFLINIWDDKFTEISLGKNHIEFCSFDEENCPFPGYCSICKEIAQQMKDEKKCQNPEPDEDIQLPF